MRRTLALALAVPLVLLATPGTQDVLRPSSAASAGPSVPDEAGTAPRPPAPAPSAPSGDASGDGAAGGPIDAPDGIEDSTSEGQGDTDAGAPSVPASGGQVAPVPGPTVGPPPSAAPAGGRVEDTFLIAAVPEQAAVAGTTGPLWRYTVEVEPALGIDPDEVGAIVRAALADDRSWARTRILEQVADPTRARIRVVLATPDTVDELCGRAGLRTVGIYSCWNGRFAALNSWRWQAGADGFPDLETYRNYLVNHEFGHGLGYGHVGCSREGALAPVMMQQSMRLDGCVANGWPYP
jgi:hypothetical protein